MPGTLSHTAIAVPAADSADMRIRQTPDTVGVQTPAAADGMQGRPHEGSAKDTQTQVRPKEVVANTAQTQVRPKEAVANTAQTQVRPVSAPAGGTNAAHRAQTISPAKDSGTANAAPTTQVVSSAPAGAPDPATPIRDTLPADSTAAVSPYPLFATADSLTAASPAVWRDTTAAALFGTRSVTVEPTRMPLAAPPSLTENAVFQSFVLLLAATYAMLLYRNLGDVRTLLGRISRDTATGERLSEDPGGSGYLRFLNIATAIGMLFMGVMVVKYGDSLMPRQPGETLPHGAVLLLSLVTTLACCVVVVFQMTAVRLAGAVTLSGPFVSQLVLLKRTYFSLAVIVTSPALLLFALCPRGTGGVWFCVVAIELVVTAILYLRETLNLFISKKISILHWFLYLCIVEIFPISLLWLLAVR